MIALSSMPVESQENRPQKKLRQPQIRVLRVLYKANGPLSRAEISRRIGNKTNVVVGRAVGYSDPEKRKAFLLTRDGQVNGIPLLDLGYVKEKELDIDGVIELVVELTPEGKAAYEAEGKGLVIGPLKDCHDMARQRKVEEAIKQQQA